MKGWMTDGRVWATAICGNNGAKSGRLNLPARDRGMVSVFCMGDCAKGVTLKGLKYTLEDAQLTGSFPLGVSNEYAAGSDCITISTRSGALVVVECEAE